jgi:hypothetical protein
MAWPMSLPYNLNREAFQQVHLVTITVSLELFPFVFISFFQL